MATAVGGTHPTGMHSCKSDIRTQIIYYHPQQSWGKVMFLKASVILSTGGSASVHAGIPLPPGTRHPPGADPPRTEHAGRYGQRADGMHPTGMQSCYLII